MKSFLALVGAVLLVPVAYAQINLSTMTDAATKSKGFIPPEFIPVSSVIISPAPQASTAKKAVVKRKPATRKSRVHKHRK